MSKAYKRGRKVRYNAGQPWRSRSALKRVKNSINQGDHHILWGLALIGFGLLVGFFWLWGNAIQVQTSEGWILGQSNGLALAPHLDIFFQIRDLWGGHLTQKQFIAYTWAWINQIILLAFSIGIEFHIGGRGRVNAWKWGSVLFIILNSLADLNYGGVFGDWWQPLAFAGLTFMASFFLGVVSLALIVEGIRHLVGLV